MFHINHDQLHVFCKKGLWIEYKLLHLFDWTCLASIMYSRLRVREENGFLIGSRQRCPLTASATLNEENSQAPLCMFVFIRERYSEVTSERGNRVGGLVRVRVSLRVRDSCEMRNIFTLPFSLAHTHLPTCSAREYISLQRSGPLAVSTRVTDAVLSPAASRHTHTDTHTCAGTPFSLCLL